jgi:aryl-alcohol dehydrogenase-like predicted oxidoreductase
VRFVEVRGVKVSAIGLGTWQFGSLEWGYGRHYVDRDALEITRRALDLGVNLIDTAEIYGLGRSERTVGRAIAGRRDEAFVASKVFPLVAVAPVVVARARASARRLGVESIDLYQVHWRSPLVPLASTVAGMAVAQRQGLIRHVGVSNFSVAQWRQADAALRAPVLSNQVQYSLVDRHPEAELLRWAESEHRLVIAYSPLAQGLLGARYDAGHRPGRMRTANPLFLPDNLQRAVPLLDTLREIAADHQATPAQVALAWVIRHPNVVAIPGASSVAQLEANVAAADLELSDEEARRLAEASDRFRPRRGPSVYADTIRGRLRGGTVRP